MGRPESQESQSTQQSTESIIISLAQVQKIVPRSSPSSRRPPPDLRKSLPPLPPPKDEEYNDRLAEVEDDGSKLPLPFISTSFNLPPLREQPPLRPKVELPPPAFVRPPLPPIPDEKPTTLKRALTASTRRLSFSTIATKPPIKYAQGKHAGVELIPQPSDDPDDPLNWPMWRKDLNFAALLLTIALVGVMKTIYMTVDAAITINARVSYTAVIALTAVPLMVSALTGMASLVLARIWGKRPVYLVSMTLILIGSLWNMTVMKSYGQNMAARVFQGLGWGAFDTLILGSILDTYFDHEKSPRIAIYYVVSIATTWGAPILGGIISSGPLGFVLQYDIINCIQIVSVPLLVFGAPETAFERQRFPSQSPGSAPPRLKPYSQMPTLSFTKAAVFEYLSKMKPYSYEVFVIDTSLILQAPRAAIAPTTLVLALAGLLPNAALWSLTSSLPRLFAAAPYNLAISSIGALFVGPFVFGLVVATALSLPGFDQRFSARFHLMTLIVGTVLAMIGIIGFGLYLQGNASGFPVYSLLLGILAAGSLTLDATVQPMIRRSAAFTSSNFAIALRNTADMTGAWTCWRNLIAGVFVLGIPCTLESVEGIQATTVGLGLAQVFALLFIALIWWKWEESVRRLDGRIMRLVDLSEVKSQASFFNMD